MDPVVLRRGGGAAAPLVVLLHGRGATEADVIGLADHLHPGGGGPEFVALRAPLAEGGGFAWFANAGIGRPLPDSLAASTAWFRAWLDAEAPRDVGRPRPVLLVGFSGGATFAGGALLADPSRFAGLATLFATLPFEAGVPTAPGHLDGVPVFVAQGDADTVIPPELQRRTWAYLHEESGADLTAVRTPGGHGMTADVVVALRDWTTRTLAGSLA
ncbi:alpha/beta hydrolase [Quadrisphaera sp. INWT6]|uniref:alpha/beta hydrolase n=1 Tax=Quadrisphaera sp. INWT6 TaxID=2596917 RepID=UPI001892152D|nr:serine esterase [Quadrisphaera sp. INWT6]MBF5081281.1 serine esterase [Quadrisphaera sp. INWT6]